MEQFNAGDQRVPVDFAGLQLPAGFVSHCGGFHLHETRPVMGVLLESEHLNSLRIAHGGLIATFADTAMGVLYRRERPDSLAPVTLSLSLDYLSPAREGEWLEAHVEILKSRGTFVSVQCLVKVGERLVTRASAVLALLSKAPTSSISDTLD